MNNENVQSHDRCVLKHAVEAYFMHLVNRIFFHVCVMTVNRSYYCDSTEFFLQYLIM